MARFLLMITALLLSCRAVAWETDQYTLSAQPIAETGEEVSRYVYEKLQLSLKLAAYYRTTYPDEIRKREVDLASKIEQLNNAKRALLHHQAAMLEQQVISLRGGLQPYLRNFQLTQSQQGIAKIITQNVGRAIATEEKKDAIWGNITNITPYSTGMKDGLATSFAPNHFDTIYAYAGFHRFLHPSHFIFSSTIKLYDIEIGMDKLGHLFNEGFQYYQHFNQAKAEGDSDQVALAKSVTWGMETEDSYYGRWVSGIYSNADLASNYIGLHFYFNLFAPLTIDGVNYPAILLQNEPGDYQLNPEPQNQPQQLLKRFISYQMNEALNPSSLEYLQYVLVKEAVLNRCEAWNKRYPDPTLLRQQASHLYPSPFKLQSSASDEVNRF
ncbi:hypothetical protein [Psychromonas sp. Urea-02u-13]|uniref:hypothetical protein n=1 Tax=Psychromonas sp. Urea-02u-13 TaxID=2058326 RepID=UPI000C33A0C2|nr:hypothetical protein [Psychromonas sp. Urea-02u-13]PKG40169.1 hypothetical protein CXF74_04990 [Psychromonas sp. Urea-02u-13]